MKNDERVEVVQPVLVVQEEECYRNEDGLAVPVVRESDWATRVESGNIQIAVMERMILLEKECM